MYVCVGRFRSSLTIVPAACWSAIVALPAALARLTKKVSSGSTVVSPLTWTVIVLAVSPGAGYALDGHQQTLERETAVLTELAAAAAS